MLLADVQKQPGFTAVFVGTAALLTIGTSVGGAWLASLMTTPERRSPVVLPVTAIVGLTIGVGVIGVTYYTAATTDGAVIGLPLVFIGLIAVLAAIALVLPSDERVWTAVAFALAIPTIFATFLMVGPDLGFFFRLIPAVIIGALGIGLGIAISIPFRALKHR